MYKMSSEKKNKMMHKLDKMIEFVEEFKECLENSNNYEEEDDEEYYEEPNYRMNRRSGSNGMSSRYRYGRGY